MDGLSEYRARRSARQAAEAAVIAEATAEWETWVANGGSVGGREILNHCLPLDTPKRTAYVPPTYTGDSDDSY
jgi:hypothetical protein